MSCYIKELQKEIKELKDVIGWVYSKIFCIGGPLNDNSLGFNKKQQKWFWNVAEYIKGDLPKENEWVTTKMKPIDW